MHKYLAGKSLVILSLEQLDVETFNRKAAEGILESCFSSSEADQGNFAIDFNTYTESFFGEQQSLDDPLRHLYLNVLKNKLSPHSQKELFKRLRTTFISQLKSVNHQDPNPSDLFILNYLFMDVHHSYRNSVLDLSEFTHDNVHYDTVLFDLTHIFVDQATTQLTLSGDMRADVLDVAEQQDDPLDMLRLSFMAKGLHKKASASIQVESEKNAIGTIYTLSRTPYFCSRYTAEYLRKYQTAIHNAAESDDNFPFRNEVLAASNILNHIRIEGSDASINTILENPDYSALYRHVLEIFLYSDTENLSDRVADLVALDGVLGSEASPEDEALYLDIQSHITGLLDKCIALARSSVNPKRAVDLLLSVYNCEFLSAERYEIYEYKSDQVIILLLEYCGIDCSDLALEFGGNSETVCDNLAAISEALFDRKPSPQNSSIPVSRFAHAKRNRLDIARSVFSAVLLREELSMPPEEFMIGAVGLLTAQQRHIKHADDIDTAIDRLRQLHEHHVGVRSIEDGAVDFDAIKQESFSMSLKLFYQKREVARKQNDYLDNLGISPSPTRHNLLDPLQQDAILGGLRRLGISFEDPRFQNRVREFLGIVDGAAEKLRPFLIPDNRADNRQASPKTQKKKRQKAARQAELKRLREENETLRKLNEQLLREKQQGPQ